MWLPTFGDDNAQAFPSSPLPVSLVIVIISLLLHFVQDVPWIADKIVSSLTRIEHFQTPALKFETIHFVTYRITYVTQIESYYTGITLRAVQLICIVIDE